MRADGYQRDRHNLPVPRTRLVGRDHDVVAVRRAVLDSEGHLVTLTGAGGCGKTRLALHVGLDLVDAFPDGVWLVEIAPVADSLLVTQVVANALGVTEHADRPLLDTLVGRLERCRLLVLLDNCEHLTGACAQLANRLLARCVGLRILATSRESLRVPGEMTWPVAPLETPDMGRLESHSETVIHSPAVELFVERARAVQPAFDLTPQNATAIAQICVQLGGLPLALELAAARVRALTVHQIAARLDSIFHVLADAGSTTSDRQYTLRAALDWSEGLLSAAERTLFRQLAVFSGGWTLEAAEAICANDGVAQGAVLEVLARLVDKSLVVASEAPGSEVMRYRLLEPTRQYAFERLQASGELDSLRARHAAYFCAVSEQAAAHPPPPLPFESLGREHDNLRSALRWVIDRVEVSTALRLGVALSEYWCRHGSFYGEGRRWLREILALPDAEPNRGARAMLLVSAGIWAGTQGDRGDGRLLLEEGLVLARDVDDQALVARALNSLGSLAEEAGDVSRARALLNDALATSRAAGEAQVQVYPLLNLGRLAYGQSDYAAARESYEAARAIATEVGDTWLLTFACEGIAYVALAQGQLEQAQAMYEAGLAASHNFSDRLHTARLLRGLGYVALARAECAAARHLFEESLALEQELGSNLGVVRSLEAFSALAAAEHRPEIAIRLAGAAAAWRRKAGLPSSLTEERNQGRWLTDAKLTLGDAAYATNWATGHAMAPDDAIALATHAPDKRADSGVSAVVRHDRRQAMGQRLSAREQEVAALVARGLSNREIAGQLVITERTAGAHVEHILGKLGFASRTQIGVWAAEHGLIAPGPS